MTKASTPKHNKHVTLPPEKTVKLAGPHFNPVIPMPPVYCVFLWVSFEDTIPFYLGVGSEYQAYDQLHLYTSGKSTLHQTYRKLLEENFLCVIVVKNVIEPYAHSVYHYLYNHLTTLPKPMYNDALFAMKPPTWIPESAKEYTVVQPLPPIPPPTVAQLVRRENLKKVLQKKLKAQIVNAKQYDKRAAEQAKILQDRLAASSPTHTPTSPPTPSPTIFPSPSPSPTSVDTD